MQVCKVGGHNTETTTDFCYVQQVRLNHKYQQKFLHQVLIVLSWMEVVPNSLQAQWYAPSELLLHSLVLLDPCWVLSL